MVILNQEQAYSGGRADGQTWAAEWLGDVAGVGSHILQTETVEEYNCCGPAQVNKKLNPSL